VAPERVAPEMVGAGTPGTTPSDLADFAFCPRSHWYRHHPPPEPPAPEAVRRAGRGARFHERALTATERRAEHGSGYWVLLLVGGLVVAGGLLWLLR
jgi:CRISPR/Cas system-associated exonuclease Cas4 (RecB family)